jgi:hypothetical protein
MTPEPTEIGSSDAVRSSLQIALLMGFAGAAGGIVIGMLAAVANDTNQVPLEISVPLALGGLVLGCCLGAFLGWISRHNPGFQRWLFCIATCALLSLLGTAWGWMITPYPNWGQYQRWVPRSTLIGATAGLTVGVFFCLIQAINRNRTSRRQTGISVVAGRPRSLAAKRLDFLFGVPLIAVVHCAMYWGIIAIAVAMGPGDDISTLPKICLGIPIAILSFPLMYLGLLLGLLSRPQAVGPLVLLLIAFSITNSLLWGVAIMRAASRSPGTGFKGR